MSFVKLVTLAAVATAFALPAAAQTDSTRRIDKRQDRQERRIEKGEKSGQLTQREAARLDKGQARVQKMEDKAVADGKLTKKEKARIEKAQDRQSKKIYRERHDKQTAK
jgi:flagellar motor protein MotB